MFGSFENYLRTDSDSISRVIVDFMREIERERESIVNVILLRNVIRFKFDNLA